LFSGVPAAGSSPESTDLCSAVFSGLPEAAWSQELNAKLFVDIGGTREENTYGIKMRKKLAREPLSESEYLALAEFRYLIRKFLRQMEETARKSGHSPQHYQLLLAIKGLPKAMRPSIGVLAERMQVNHNSTVELVDRCEKRGLLRRVRRDPDRRQVMLEITPQGEAFMRKQASVGREQLRAIGPVLLKSIQRVIHDKSHAKDSNEPSRSQKRSRTQE
jgi:DNA-binding MarR family transcriptional regulator